MTLLLLQWPNANRYAVSKYVHAVEYANEDSKPHESAMARRSVHETLQKLAKQAQELSQTSPALISTALNIVKTSCESSFEYMQDILYTKSMEWVSVGENIDSMLSFLLKSVHKIHTVSCFYDFICRHQRTSTIYC